MCVMYCTSLMDALQYLCALLVGLSLSTAAALHLKMAYTTFYPVFLLMTLFSKSKMTKIQAATVNEVREIATNYLHKLTGMAAKAELNQC